MRTVFYILSIICVTLLLVNFNLLSKLESLSKAKENCEYKHRVTQGLYDLMRDEVLRLEDENQLLGSFLAEKETINQ